jgi:hypothetical protein
MARCSSFGVSSPKSNPVRHVFTRVESGLIGAIVLRRLAFNEAGATLAFGPS